MTAGYLAYLRRRNRAEGTIRAYGWGLQDLGRWLDGEHVRRLDRLTEKHLEAWQDNMAKRDLAPRTRQLAVNAVRTALRWAIREGYDLAEDLDECLVTPAAPKLIPRPLDDLTVNRVNAYLAPRRPHASLLYLRTRALWFYLVTTGARVSEALSLDRADFEDDDTIVMQKGGTQKLLLAPPVAIAAVVEYLVARDDGHPALFVTHGDPPVRRLAPAGAREGWHRLADQLHLPRWNTHRLRHTCATELIDAGIPVEVVAEHLGHHGLATVMGYAKVSARRRAAVVDAMQTRFGLGSSPRPAA